MDKTQCFKIKRGTKYDKEIKEHFELRKKWGLVFEKVSDLLGEKITRLALSSTNLIIEPSEIENNETKKLFKKSGEIKSNSNKAKDTLKSYKQIIKDLGLEGFEDLPFINFRHGVMRTYGQELESFVTSDNDIYYKANFNLEKKSGGNVVPVTEIEYEESYLKELKRKEKRELNAQ